MARLCALAVAFVLPPLLIWVQLWADEHLKVEGPQLAEPWLLWEGGVESEGEEGGVESEGWEERSTAQQTIAVRQVSGQASKCCRFLSQPPRYFCHSHPKSVNMPHHTP